MIFLSFLMSASSWLALKIRSWVKGLHNYNKHKRLNSPIIWVKFCILNSMLWVCDEEDGTLVLNNGSWLENSLRVSKFWDRKYDDQQAWNLSREHMSIIRNLKALEIVQCATYLVNWEQKSLYKNSSQWFSLSLKTCSHTAVHSLLRAM